MSSGDELRPRTAVVPVNGVTLFTRSVGAGPPVVVLHGGPGAHHDYLLPQYDALAGRRTLRYYDQRGGGRSKVSGGVALGWREHVADLRALLDHWEIDQATLLGYSWGGLLALLFAIGHPERVGRLALVAPAPAYAEARAVFERRFAARMAAPQILQARTALARSGLRERDPERYRRRLFELSVAGYFKDFERARELSGFRVTARTQAEVWASLGNYDLRERLQAIDVPSLVLHGAHDPMPIEAARETAALLGARFEVLDCGHAPHVEQFETFVALLDGFLPQAS